MNAAYDHARHDVRTAPAPGSNDPAEGFADAARLGPQAGAAPAPRARQLRALAGAEWRELLRNKVALFNSLALPLVMGVILFGIGPEGAPMGVLFPVMVTGTAILFVVYYTLVTAVVARRESLLLKRLRSGEASDATILAGVALPFVLVTCAQFVVAAALARALFDVSLSPLTAVAALGVLLATVAFATLAVASTPFTRTVEHAQITTLPIIMIPLVFSGMMLPLTMMPDALRTVAELLPLTPIVELLHLGFASVTVDGEAVSAGAGLLASVRPLLVLIGWAVLGFFVASRRMRWEPRS